MVAGLLQSQNNVAPTSDEAHGNKALKPSKKATVRSESLDVEAESSGSWLIGSDYLLESVELICCCDHRSEELICCFGGFNWDKSDKRSG